MHNGATFTERQLIVTLIMDFKKMQRKGKKISIFEGYNRVWLEDFELN